MSDRPARRKQRWFANLAGGLIEFAIEAMVVAVLALVALLLAVAFLALV